MSNRILLIILDQLRADFVFGAPAAALRLPNLRKLMAEGVSFKRHYTVASPCGPSRASLLTGLYAMNHRSIRNGTPLERRSGLGAAMRRAGVTPLLFGYADVSPDPAQCEPGDPALQSYEGPAPDFEELLAMRFESQYAWRAALRERGYDLPAAPAAVYRPARGDGEAAIRSPALFKAEDSDSAFLTDAVIRELGVRADRSWCAWIAYLRPHPPLVAPAPYNRLYASDALPPPHRPHPPEAMIAAHPYYRGALAAREPNDLFSGHDGDPLSVSEAACADLRAVYAGLLSEVDDCLGRLFDALRRDGALDDALIVLTADHGDMLGDHHLWGKMSMHDPALRIPLIVSDPRRPAAAGRSVDAFTESVDILPTLLDWLGVAEPPRGLDGRSLLPFLEGGKTPDDWRDCAFSEIDLGDPLVPTPWQRAMGVSHRRAGMAILRERDFLLTCFAGGAPPLLFDLGRDRNESVEVGGDPAYRETMRRLLETMIAHRMTHAYGAATDFKTTEEGLRAAPRSSAPL